MQAEEEQDIVVHYQDTVEVFDKDLQLSLSDIRGHFGVSGGSLKVNGKVKVVKPDVIVPPGTYVLDIPQRNQALPAPSSTPPANPTTTPIPAHAPAHAPAPNPPTPTLPPQPSIPQPTPTIQPDKSSPQESTERPALPSSTEDKGERRLSKSAGDSHDVLSPKLEFNLKREIESPSTLDPKKQKISEIKQSPLSFGINTPTATVPTKLMEQLETKPLPKPGIDPSLFLPTFQKDPLKQPKKTEDKQEDRTNNKENITNYDSWKTKINISTTNSGSGSKRTQSVIASISTSSKPTTPERKRQKNEIITRILAREADRKTLRETFMNVEQIKDELTEEAKPGMSSSEILHLCEVSWFNKFRESN